jgi:hypothetical protein
MGEVVGMIMYMDYSEVMKKYIVYDFLKNEINKSSV